MGNLRNVFYVDDMPVEMTEVYKKWFDDTKIKNNFQMDDADWIRFVDGTLNIFYKTGDYKIDDDGAWYVILLNSSEKALKVAEEQMFHGNPNLNTFWKIASNGKYDEIGGRRNGYVFSDRLRTVPKSELKRFRFALVFQCPETVSIQYLDRGQNRVKYINWAGNVENIVMCQLDLAGRFRIIPVALKSEPRVIPSDRVPMNAMHVSDLSAMLDDNYAEWFHVEQVKEEREKTERTSTNARKNALSVMWDEQIPINLVITNVDEFINNGNVSQVIREENKKIREAKLRAEKDRKSASRRSEREFEKTKAKQLKYKIEKYRRGLMFN